LLHTMAIGNDGWLYAWGGNAHGELGVGDHTDRSKPIRVLKVCPPLSMTGTIAAPAIYKSPFTVTATIKNSGVSSLLQNVNAAFVPAGPVVNDTSMFLFLGNSLSSGATGALNWSGSTHQYYFSQDTPDYYVYIQAAGSAPLILRNRMLVPGVPIVFHNVMIGEVQDTLTHAPIEGAEVDGSAELFLGSQGARLGTTYTDRNGNYSMDIIQIDSAAGAGSDVFGVQIKKENYNPAFVLQTQQVGKSLYFDSVWMGPSGIQGEFTPPSKPYLPDTLMKVYFPDSLIGYAISRRVIFRTRDSGITWNPMYETSADLKDLKFEDPARGWVVGDNGTLLSTSDTGNNWTLVPTGTHQALRGLALADRDTSWAVGDGGTILRRTDTSWQAMKSVGNTSLTCVDFFDPTHGVCGTANGNWYLYANGAWKSYAPNSYPPVYPYFTSARYLNPGKFFLSAKAGGLWSGAPGSSSLGLSTIGGAATMHSLSMLNHAIGFIAGDSGNSFVTYDAGTWTRLPEFPGSATSVNFFGLAGHIATENTVLNYTGRANYRSGVVCGRFTAGEPPEPVHGSKIYKVYVVDTLLDFYDSTYTDEQGWFAFSNVDTFFHYEYLLTYPDSGMLKSFAFPNVRPHPGEVVRLNYNEYIAPPQPPDTVLSVGASIVEPLSMTVSSEPDAARIVYDVPIAGYVRLVIHDILGRTVQTIVDGTNPSGETVRDVSTSELSAGIYYVTLERTGESITKKFEVIR
ncbi:MAG TPA: YCF48-related protein, partial [Candidatus Kapabacteria bacterium]